MGWKNNMTRFDRDFLQHAFWGQLLSNLIAPIILGAIALAISRYNEISLRTLLTDRVEVNSLLLWLLVLIITSLIILSLRRLYLLRSTIPKSAPRLEMAQAQTRRFTVAIRLAVALMLLALTLLLLFGPKASNTSQFDRIPIVMIGEEIWTERNLDIDTYVDGSPIPRARNRDDWMKFNSEGKGCWCYYKDEPDSGRKYGKIYNWYAINDERGFVPKGWHVAELDEVKKFIKPYLFTLQDLKSTVGWPDTGHTTCNGTNKSGFNALPGGYCTDSFYFEKASFESGWWTKSPRRSDTQWMYFYNIDCDSLYGTIAPKNHGFYIRCVKDNSLLENHPLVNPVYPNR